MSRSRLIRREVRELACPLSDPELLERSAELSSLMRTIEIREEEMRERNAETREEIKQARMRAKLLAIEIRTKAAMREIAVDLVAAPGKLVQIIRRDTGEILLERAALAGEEQIELLDAVVDAINGGELGPNVTAERS